MQTTKQIQSNAWPMMLVLLTMTWLGAACGGSGKALHPAPMPEGGSYTGVWFSPQYGRIDMIQNGSAVVGEYKKDEREGKIQGTVDGDLMRFTWEEHRALVANRPTITRGRGYFRYLVDPSSNEHQIDGEWGIDDDETGGGPWTAVKSTKMQPELSGGSSGGSTSGGYGGGQSDSYDSDIDDLF